MRLLTWFLAIAVALVAGAIAFAVLSKPSGLLSKLQVSYVIIDMASGKYKIEPALANGIDGTESFSSMVSRLKPVAAITGTYYNSDCRPMGDIVIGGEVVSRGAERQGIGFTRSGHIRFVERKPGKKINWRGCVSGVACGPRLLRAGKLDIDVHRDGFRSSASVTTAWRCAVGSTRDGKLILCAVSDDVTLASLGEVMLDLGAWDAVNMDGGKMCALYSNGSVRVEPVSGMSNIIAVYRK